MLITYNKMGGTLFILLILLQQGSLQSMERRAAETYVLEHSFKADDSNITEATDVIHSLKQVYELDLSFTKQVLALLEVFVKRRLKQLDRLHLQNGIQQMVHTIGSASEGGWSARLFQCKKFFIEMDNMGEAFIIPDKPVRDAILVSTGKPGFYRLKRERIIETLADVLETKREYLVEKLHSESEFVSGYMVRDLVEETMVFRDKGKVANVITAAMFGGFPEDYKVEHVFEQNGPAVTLIVQVLRLDQEILSLSIDDVAGVRLTDFWPPEAVEWLVRERHWPPMEVISAIAAMDTHLVPKSSDSGREYSDEWRLSFVLAEKRLTQARTPIMSLTYYLFKVLFYTNFKEVEFRGETLASYLAKTTMMWACEELPEESWTEQKLGQNLNHLLSKLISALREKQLPNYFMRELNLLKHTPQELIDGVLGGLPQNLVTEPLLYLPRNVMDILDKVRLIKEKVDIAMTILQFFVDDMFKL